MLSPLSSPRPRLKALLVEDSPQMREVLMESLVDVPGLDVAGVADTAQDAIAAFDCHCPDIVILDLALRVGSGLDVLREIKQRTRACQVLVFTGHDQASYRQHCLGAGADFFFSKNREHQELLEQLRRMGEAKSASV